ncbi:MAG: EutN/CcmL family microcompartment protein [Elusimicrobiota bacterium]|nr:EutN/CcmL family microcompartment protein [Elusimicrobiota bacterium]
MFVGEVVGNVWATRKHKGLEDRRMLLVRPIDPMTQKPLGDAQMAVEGGVGAGPGSIVLVMDEGGSARSVMKDDKAPVRTIVVAIVDAVSSGGKVTKYD